MKFSYNNLKTLVYIIGFCLTIYSVLKFGLIDSHTPPLGFVIPVFFLILGFIWVIVDWVLSFFFEINSNKLQKSFYWY